jgi:hypothetical protein
MYSALVFVHVLAATIGLISGALAMVFRKGSDLHRVAGTFFFVSMLTMSGIGALIAGFIKPNGGNVMGGTVTFYLVATAWMAGHRREKRVGAFDVAFLVFALTIASAGGTWGVQAAARGSRWAPIYFVFGTIAFLFAISDVRMLVRGGVSGAQRIGRHLWRMSLSFMIALLSFYPGQARLFPAEWKKSPLMFAPHILLAAATIYWLVRTLRRRRSASLEMTSAAAQPV